MAGKRQRSLYRPKREGKGFGGCKKGKNLGKKASEEVEIDRAKPRTSHEGADASDSEDSDQALSSLMKKMKLFHSTEESLNSSDEESTGQCEATGYRLIDLQSLSSVLSAAHKCEEGEKITLTDFTKPFDCSSGLKNKPISVYNLTS